MKISDKVKIYCEMHAVTASCDFGQRNLILAKLASGLGLKHWIGDGVFELAHTNRKKYLVALPISGTERA